VLKSNYDILGNVVNTAFVMHKEAIKGAGEFVESFRPNQIKSKAHLVEEIANTNTSYKNVLVVGSWNGILLYELMKENCDVGWYDFMDIDPLVHKHRDLYFEINKIKKNYSNINMDATEFSDYQDYDLVINTSCEHMKTIPAVYGPLYALQSNNYKSIKEHINCMKDVNHMKDEYRISNVLFSDELDMGHYKRFTLIGSCW
jgi:hypothetical protein